MAVCSGELEPMLNHHVSLTVRVVEANVQDIPVLAKSVFNLCICFSIAAVLYGFL
jgi:hypothetical protein